MTRSALSLEYVECVVTLTVAGVSVNPTDLDVFFAFPKVGVQPTTEDFQPGSWASTSSPYMAQTLVGPGGTHALPAGRYDAWIKIADAPELVVRHFDQLTLT